MYSSKEIRWFFKNDCDQIRTWFNSHSLSFLTTQPRSDFYLPINGKDDISIKIREGNLEIKQRIGKPILGRLTDNVEGYFEDWVKWSFGIKNEDKLSGSIINENKYNWIKVKKERIGLKLSKNKNNETEIANIDTFLDYGCQIEYTRLHIVNNNTWFTFGLEWFGELNLELDSAFLKDLLVDTILKIEDSMGYSQFLTNEKNNIVGI